MASRTRLADPRALEQCYGDAAVRCISSASGGLPGDAQAVIYLSVRREVRCSDEGFGEVTRKCRPAAEPVPMHLRNAPTKAMKSGGMAPVISMRHSSKMREPDGVRSGIASLANAG